MATELFEVEVKNRVVKGSFDTRRIKGTQGDWYQECLYYLAESKEETEEFEMKALKSSKEKDLVSLAMRIRNNEIPVNREEVQALLAIERVSTILERCVLKFESIEKHIDQKRLKSRGLINTYSPNPMIDEAKLNEVMEDKEEKIVKRFKEITAQLRLIVDEVKI